jgi:hydrogenase maturation protease
MSPSEFTPACAKPPQFQNSGGPVTVVAYGNTLRSDDGVARRLAEELEELGLPQIQVISCDLLLPELAEAVSRAERVIFVDAEVNSTEPVRAHKVVAAESSQLMAHHASAAVILALARDVFSRAPEAWLVTIPGQDFGIGEGLSEIATRGKKRALELIQAIQLRADCVSDR